MGWTSFDDFLEQLTVNDQTLEAEFYKVSTLPEIAGGWHSLWKVGHFPGPGTDPAGTPGVAYVTEAGGLAGWANQSPDTKHLLTFGAVANNPCQLMLYDRLVGVGGLSVASTGDKTVSSATLPRYTSGQGVQAWLEVTTATTTTAPIVSMNSYTDQDGNTGAAGATITFPATATNVDTLIGPLPLAAGDRGVQAVSTINVATAGSAGVCNLILIKPLAVLPLTSNVGNIMDFMTMMPSLPRIYDGATLGLAFIPTSASATTFWGSIRGGYG